jgi:hypothetical protein
MLNDNRIVEVFGRSPFFVTCMSQLTFCRQDEIDDTTVLEGIVQPFVDPSDVGPSFQSDRQLLLPENAAFVAHWEWEQTVWKTYEYFEAHVLPHLRGLVPTGTLDMYRPPPCCPGNEMEAFHVLNLRLIVMVISNNICAMTEIPEGPVIDSIRIMSSTLFKRMETDHEYIWQAFGEKLLSYAIYAKDALFVDALLSDARYQIDLDRVHIRTVYGKYTPIELSAELLDLATTRVLVHHICFLML